MIEVQGKQMLSQSKFYMGYSRWVDDLGRYETWDESVSRVMDMHREKYVDKMTDELEAMISFAESAYKDKKVLGAQRALQFGGKQLFDKNARMYNCSTIYADRASFFQESLYLLLCGCGVGFSVQKQHIVSMPKVKERYHKKSKVHVVDDSIEGWADALGVLVSSYMEDGGTFPEYKGCKVHFDYNKIRPKGAFISGGFKAPGPDGLRDSLNKCEDLLDRLTLDKTAPVSLPSIVIYDLVMYAANAVLSGGVRRSATICMFSKDDHEMLNAKTGDWFVTNPQRGRSNNSVMLKRDDITREEFANIMKSVKDFGEPGFIFTDNLDFCYNPCVEIGMMPKLPDGRTGVSFCNLTEINGGACSDKQKFLDACKAAAILGTLQAGYTDFKYLSEATKEIVEKEALIGVSVTGWMNQPEVLFDEQNMIDGANLVKHVNATVAAMIGINPAARTTAVKPSGNASVLLGTASGIHGEHSPMYFRNVQINEQDQIMDIIKRTNPKMIEKSVWSSSGTDVVVSFPVVSVKGSKYKKELLGVKQLEYVKQAQQFWVEHGTREELGFDPKLRHNVSNTITVDDWDEVEEYIYNNRYWFAGISLLSASGDKAYPQSPFTEIHTAQEILDMYGEASMFASGLVVDGLHAFNNNLWGACDTACGFGEVLDPEQSEHLLKRDWVRRMKKYADTYFSGNLNSATNCLKDCYNLHKWESIKRNFKFVDFSQEMQQQMFTDVDTIGAVACSGGTCEVSF